MSTGLNQGYSFSRLLRLSGDLRDYGSSNTDFKINLGNSVQAVKKVSFLHVSFPNSAYNILAFPHTDFNNLIIFNYYNGSTLVSSQTVTVPQGFYDIDTLVDYLNLQSINGITFFSVTNASGTAHITVTLPVGITKIDVVQQTGTGVLNSMGFPFSQFVSDGPNQFTLNSADGQNLPSLAGITEVFLQSAVLGPGNSIDEEGKINNICVAIPITVAWGDLQTTECFQDSLCQVTFPTARNIQVIDIQLVDRDGSVIDINGGNLKVDLRVWFDRL